MTARAKRPVVTYPPAFPESCTTDGVFGGMTLRDYFAGQAIPGLALATPEGDREWSPVSIANWAYRIADAMLKERAK